MSAITLDLTGDQVFVEPATPRRVVLTAEEVDRLSELCGWRGLVADFTADPASAGDLARRLGDVDGGQHAAQGPPGSESRDPSADPDPQEPRTEGVDAALRAAGLLLASGDVDAEVRAALSVWHSSTLTVEVDLRLALRGGDARVRSWHRSRGDWVVCLSSTDGSSFELAWMQAVSWHHELARVALVDPRWLRPAGEESGLPDVVETPWELLLATGEAARQERDDLLTQLVATHSGLTTYAEEAGEPLAVADDASTVRWHGALEEAGRGRLHAAVVGRNERGRAGVGLVEWVLFADGWRSLTPVVEGGRRMVRIERVSCVDLGRDVAVRAAEVTS